MILQIITFKIVSFSIWCYFAASYGNLLAYVAASFVADIGKLSSERGADERTGTSKLLVVGSYPPQQK